MEILKIKSRAMIANDIRFVAAHYHNTDNNIAMPTFKYV